MTSDTTEPETTDVLVVATVTVRFQPGDNPIRTEVAVDIPDPRVTDLALTTVPRALRNAAEAADKHVPPVITLPTELTDHFDEEK